MKYYSTENIERIKPNENLYDMFYPMLKDEPNIVVSKYVVREEREMRMDLICLDIYGSTKYIDELMHINGIINPYSVKIDDIIYYPDKSLLGLLLKNYEGNLDELKIKSKQKNIDGDELTTSTPYSTFLPVTIDKNRREINIINKLK